MKRAISILLVDDDVDDQVYFKDAINELCNTLRCEIASNGLEALDKIDVPPPPDLIFLDLNMPVMSGFECLASLKKQERYKDIPVVIFTTSKNHLDIDQARQLGADLFFTKPTSFELLCTKLDKILEMDFKSMQFTC